MSVVIGKVVRFSKMFLGQTKVDTESMKHDLTIEGKKNSEFGSREALVTYSECDKYIFVPKVYGMSLLKEKGFPFLRIDHPGQKIDVSFSGKLRENQVAVVQDTVDALRRTEGAVMNMYCGFGKTTCCNFITCELKLKTLVLVHSSSLVEQWKQRIEQFVKGSSVGLVRQNTFDIDGRTHVIALMQSICKREYPKKAFQSFGLTVIDECHHVCAEQLSRCLQKAGSRYRLGLSATPFRKDGFTPFLFQAVGAISCTVERDHSTQDIDVHAVELDVGPSEVHYIRRSGKKSVNIARMITELTEHEGRTDCIVGCVKKLATGGRQVMVLSDRRSHLQIMHQALVDTAYTTSFMVGGVPPDAMRLAETATVIFATYAYASEGVDVPSLDTVVFATPRVDVVQTTGRILRKHDDKQKPLVVDFVDVFSLFQNQFSKRLKYYKKLGADVTHMDQCLNAREIVQEAPAKRPKFAFSASVFK